MTRTFRSLLKGGRRLKFPSGPGPGIEAEVLRRYSPRYELRLFGWRYFLTSLRYDDALGFFVAFLVQEDASGDVGRGPIYPRIFYKDSSLIWRVATHFVHDESEYWIGKGDVRERTVGDYVVRETAEETTNLPFELQRPMDELSRREKRVRDDRAIGLILKEAPSSRIEAYADFTRPRREAAERVRINGGRPIARFARRGDPSTLRFARGFEPDFASAVEAWTVVSRFFGGELRKVRILSVNKKVQYLFFSSPTHVWLAPPQALTEEVHSYGVRLVDVMAPDDLSIPGFEYHDCEESQIPGGYAGAAHPDDPHRADASRWLDAMPVIAEFRRSVLRAASAR